MVRAILLNGTMRARSIVGLGRSARASRSSAAGVCTTLGHDNGDDTYALGAAPSVRRDLDKYKITVLINFQGNQLIT